jgi:signal transduction histidine kinase
MRATSYLAPRPAAGAAPGDGAGAAAADTVPAGAAMATLMAVAARTAWTIRSIAVGYIVLQVVIWHSFFTARPERLAGPAVAVLGAAAVIARLRWSRAGWRLAVLDTAVVAALAVGTWWCVPPAMQGDTSSWLYIAVVSQLIVPAWFAPAALFVPLTLACAAAFWAGAVRATPATPGSASPAAAAANALAIGAVAWCALGLLRRRARAADAALARADAESRAEYVALSLSTERREHERLLHDTVLNTLTALGRGAERASGAEPGDAEPAALDQAAAAARCQHDVALIEHALGARGDGGPAGGLLAAIDAVATEMRARGLTVHVTAVRGDAPAADGPPRPGDPSPAGQFLPGVPDSAGTALAYAVREALANVAAHAGTTEAWVEVGPAGGPGPGDGGVEIAVRDHGAGFDPGAVDPARLGLRRSVTERVADGGGQAAVRSAPGAGTVVILRWPAPAGRGPAPARARGTRPAAAAAVPPPAAAAVPPPAAAAVPPPAAAAVTPAAARLPAGPPP